MAQALRPLFITVTWGAGGSTSERSLELAEICQRQLGLTTCLHLTCTNMSKKLIDETLASAKELGIRNILALRGDPPREHEYRLDARDYEGSEDFVWAVDLVRYIRKEYGNYFCIGVAGYPEGHSDESVPANQDPRHDMPYLVKKVQAGGDFIMTQLFYDEDAYFAYEKLVHEWDGGVLKDITIIPGLMPIQSYAILKRTSKLSHAKLPPAILEKLERVKGDDEAVKRVGVDIISTIVNDVKRTPSARRRGFHFYTLNLEKAVSYILERCNLIPPTTPGIEVSSAIEDLEPLLANGTLSDHSNEAPSKNNLSSNNHITSDSRSTNTLEPVSRATNLAISHGVGSLGREATWDDFPNGRFGDARSPAFGEIDGYGTSLHMSPAAARSKWGTPTTRGDIGRLFTRHLRDGLDQLPWSEGVLSDETRLIKTQLCRLIEEKGWWSVASQPAVDGIKSSDPTFGWGPSGGFVFQKAFVEFWIPTKDWTNVLRPHLRKPEIAAQVSWYASPNPRPTKPSQSATNGTNGTNGTALTIEVPTFESNSETEEVNSVTWGSFPGKEIVTPTIIEEISFRAWAEEAFGIWREWERCYVVGSESRKLIKGCAEEMCLVNVIGHRYRETEALWNILLSV